MPPHLSAGTSLIDLFVHWIVRSLAWRAGGEIAHLLGPFLLVIALVVVVVYIMRRRRAR
jgi:hypothetical protein